VNLLFKLIFSQKALEYIKQYKNKEERSGELNKFVVVLFFHSTSM